MSNIAHHLVRRAFDATQNHLNTMATSNEGKEEPHLKKLATWGIVLLCGTAMLYLAAISAISYTYGEVVATLTMIETPTATAFKTTAEEEHTEVDAPLLSGEQKSEKAAIKALEADLFLVKQPPITAKLRTTVKHLRSVGGRLARFRGFHVAMIYTILHGCIVGFFAPHGRPGFMRPLVSIIATIALCRIQMTWTHVVISNPSQKSWWRRYPSGKMARNIVLPTAIFAIAEQFALYVTVCLTRAVYHQIEFPERYGANYQTALNIAVAKMIGIFIIAVGTTMLIVIPAEVTLKRVQASMLPEEDETIVPFDRTFAGKVKPEVLGGSGCVGMFDAWKSFDKDARIRLLKLYAKVFALQAATTFFFTLAAIAELRLIMGDDFNKAIKMGRDALRP